MVSRRMALMVGGAGAVLVGAAGFRLHSNLGPAQAPWKAAGRGFGDPRLDALSYAVLAPSPHNTQPWLVRLDGEDELTVFCDLDRRLPATDPQDRQIVIGLGAFMELLRQAAAETGYRVDIDAFPGGEPFPVLDKRPVARCRFAADAGIEKDPLFAAIPRRRTARQPFDTKKPVSAAAMAALSETMRADDGVFDWTLDNAAIAALKDICKRAWRIEMAAPGPRHESAIYTRIGEKEINARPDGIFLSGPVMEAMGALGVLTPEKMDDPASTAYAETIKFYERNIDTAMAFGWLTTEYNSRKDQLRAGAGWVRLQLAATQAGLSMQPFSQALQEYPEMAGIYEEAHAFAALRPPAVMQGLFRFGYGGRGPAAPRWSMATRILNIEA